MKGKANHQSNRIRELYRKKGILNDEAMRPEILKSWERSKIYQSAINNFGIFESLKESNAGTHQQVSIFFEKLALLHPTIRGIYLVNLEGQVEDAFVKEENFVSLRNWSERRVGTTAYSLYKENKHINIVDRSEHFLPLFDNFATMAIPLLDRNLMPPKDYDVIILLLSAVVETAKILENVTDEYAKMIERLECAKTNLTENQTIDFNKKAPNLLENSEFSNFNRHLLSGISREIVEFKEKLNAFNANYNYLRIGAETVNEGLAVASFMVDNFEFEKRHNHLIAIISENKIHRHSAVSSQNFINPDVLIIVGLQKLTYEQQRQVYRIIQHKMNTSSPDVVNNVIKKRVYLIEPLNDNSFETAPMILDGLRILLTAPKIILPPIRHRRQDVASLIKDLEAELSKEVCGISTILEQSLVGHGTAVNWRGSADELSRWVIFNHGQGVDVLADVSCLTVQREEAVPKKEDSVWLAHQVVEGLKEEEKASIQKALKVYNYNINKTAKALKIARSTLYRKIKDFELQIERRHNKCDSFIRK